MAERIEVDSSDRVPAPGGKRGPHWGRRMVTLLIAIAAVGGFALVVLYSYNQSGDGKTGGKAPVITAQKGPTKVRPESPGGMDVPNRDKQVYGRIDTAKQPEVVERLLPPPEPVAKMPPAETSTADAGKRASEIEKDQARIASELSAIAPAAGKSDAAAPPAPPPAQVAAVPSAPTDQAKASPKPAVEPAGKPASMAKPKKAKPHAKGSSSYRIQIAALRSEGAARKAWDRYTKKNKDLLGKLEPNIERVELAGKGTFYRLQAGPLGGASEAKSLCSRLKKRKIGCLVVRP